MPTGASLRAGRRGRRLKAGLLSNLPPFFSSFQRGFAVVARFAQTLQICRVSESHPVPAVWLDVIHYRGVCALAGFCTLPAERLLEQMVWPEVVCPDWQGVPGMICGTVPSPAFGPVFGTPAVACKLGTPSMSAGPQWFQRHGLSPPWGNKKSLGRHVSVIMWLRLKGSGSGRYSRYAPCGSACNKAAGAWQRCRATRAGAFGDGTPDR